jgi:L-asparaginase
MQSNASLIVVLGTGGTIAGRAADASDNIGYVAAQLEVGQLVGAIPQLGRLAIEVEQIVQLDSKDMSFAVWLTLARAVHKQLARQEVQAVVITHGTDTLEETAYFLQRVLAPTKPVVMVAAMRPATALQSDGPQNLVDAMDVARHEHAHGVVVVLAGKVHSALDLRKLHTYRLDAFGSGDAGVLAHIEQGQLRQHRPWPSGDAIGVDRLFADETQWPRVEIIASYAGASDVPVRLLQEAGVRGIVVAGTGNGSVHHLLEAALIQAQLAGVAVLRCSRFLDGSVIEGEDASLLPSAGALTPVQARIELILKLMRAT